MAGYKHPGRIKGITQTGQRVSNRVLTAVVKRVPRAYPVVHPIKFPNGMILFVESTPMHQFRRFRQEIQVSMMTGLVSKLLPQFFAELHHWPAGFNGV